MNLLVPISHMRAYGPYGPIWAWAHMGQGAFGPGPIGSCQLGPGPGPGPSQWSRNVSFKNVSRKIEYVLYHKKKHDPLCFWDPSKRMRTKQLWFFAVVARPELSRWPDWWQKRWIVNTYIGAWPLFSYFPTINSGWDHHSTKLTILCFWDNRNCGPRDIDFLGWHFVCRNQYKNHNFTFALLNKLAGAKKPIKTYAGDHNSNSMLMVMASSFCMCLIWQVLLMSNLHTHVNFVFT